jgi:(p)ppGpp synthase/HD superfamily hydrolase
VSIVERAKELAHRAHAGQVDKAGRPYIEHVARVAAAVSGNPEDEAVAWAHDIIEDCSSEFDDELFEGFPEDVYECVYTLSRDSITSDEDYYYSIRRHPLALRVKLADIADNADESRLALLDKATADRLRRKYAKALKALTEHEAG